MQKSYMNKISINKKKEFQNENNLILGFKIPNNLTFNFSKY